MNFAQIKKIAERGTQNVLGSIVKTQRQRIIPRSENHEVVSTLAIAILRAAGTLGADASST